MAVDAQPNGTASHGADALAARLAAVSLADDAGPTLLRDLRVACSGRRVPPAALRAQLPLPALLQWLDLPDAVDDVCAVLAHSFADLDGPSLQQHSGLIQQGLRSPLPQVRAVCLDLVRRLPLPRFLPDLWDTVGIEDLAVAEKATKLLVELAGQPEASAAIYAPESLRILEYLYERDDIAKHRVLEAVARIGSTSDAAFQASVTTGIPQRLADEIDFDGDLLGALAALELCAQLVRSSPHGLALLEQLGILRRLAETLGTSEEELVTSNVVRFFGQIGAVMDAVPAVEAAFRSYGILDRVQPLMEEPTRTLETSLFVFVENLSSSSRGLALLKEQDRVVSAFVQAYRSASTDGRLVALHAVSVFVESCPPELADYARRVFEDLGRTPLKDMVHLCRSALEENRVAGYSVLKALARHEWGLRALASHEVVDNFLFDRRTDQTRTGMEFKYSIVQAMDTSPAAGAVLHPELRARITRYLNEGPFFKPTEASVAFMSS
ncbi:26S proteasome non-ATPase regulatory subunit 5 [Hyaloraphidium curvatum]|nr:26S proteasome non-ATPase regulatory subunit 5 [Hyaloraphidium curvatum]